MSMPDKNRKWNCVPLVATMLALLLLAAVAITAKSLGFVLNVTASMPGIVYRLGNGERGSVTAFCSPIQHPSLGRGSCPDGSLPLIKRVAGVAGDVVTATDAGVEINGRLCPQSRPLDLDSQGKTLPHLRGVFVLKDDEVWVAGENENSFDSRYFGPVKPK
jgi:conjugative transfer signal peptidase TraF